MAKKPLQIPDASGGQRGCVACDNRLSVAATPRNPRRYTCNPHGTSTAQEAKAKRMRETNQRIVYRLWGKAYGDSKRFNCAWKSLDGVTVHTKTQSRVALTLREIEELLRAATDYPSKEIFDNPMEFARGIAVIPRNPKEVLSLSNAALVTNTTKRKLFCGFKLDGLQGYANALTEAQRGFSMCVFLPTREQIKMMQSKLNLSLETGEV